MKKRLVKKNLKKTMVKISDKDKSSVLIKDKNGSIFSIPKQPDIFKEAYDKGINLRESVMQD